MRYRWLARVGFWLLLAEMILVLVSWILSATMTEGVRSLLSSEGIRWYLGGFVRMMASPVLVWLLLLLIAFGTFQKSGLPSLFSRHQPLLTYRERTALRMALTMLIGYIGVVALLVLSPHAILLSASGSLFPSAFSRCLPAFVAFGITLFSVAFGMMSGRLRLLTDVLGALSFGIAQGAPLFVIYILLMQFYESIRFVL